MLDILCVQALSTVFALLSIFSALLAFLHLYCPLLRVISVEYRKRNIFFIKFAVRLVKFYRLNLTFVFTNSKSSTFIIFVLTYSSICKISIDCISVKPFCCSASQHRCTCSMHGENEQNRPPGIQREKYQ